MIDYSFASDYAVAPLPSTSSYIAKINQKWYILFIYLKKTRRVEEAKAMTKTFLLQSP